jgi:3-oxoacyl-[acyl-carrier protein] reductase
MDLGIRGRRALVTGASKGLGRGCAEALAAAGVDLVINARGAEALEAAAGAIRAAHGVEVTAVAADIASEDGRSAALEAAGGVDILVTNAGGPPPGSWRDWAREDFQRAIEANMLTPILLMQALLPGMCDRGWGRVVNITSTSVKAPLAALGLSNTARAGLTGYVAGCRGRWRGRASRSTIFARKPRHRPHRQIWTSSMAREGVTREAGRGAATIPAAGAYGTAEEFGGDVRVPVLGRRLHRGQNIALDGSTNRTFEAARCGLEASTYGAPLHLGIQNIPGSPQTGATDLVLIAQPLLDLRQFPSTTGEAWSRGSRSRGWCAALAGARLCRTYP